MYEGRSRLRVSKQLELLSVFVAGASRSDDCPCWRPSQHRTKFVHVPLSLHCEQASLLRIERGSRSGWNLFPRNSQRKASSGSFLGSGRIRLAQVGREGFTVIVLNTKTECADHRRERYSCQYCFNTRPWRTMISP
jgi:hypothetical protein